MEPYNEAAVLADAERDSLREQRYELLAAMNEIANMAAKRSRVNMPDGTSLELFARAAIVKAEGRS